MYLLYQNSLDPMSRALRIALLEKHAEFRVVDEPFWLRRPEFLALNPAGTVPVLVEDNVPVAVGAWAACEFIDEVFLDGPLMGESSQQRAETRRLIDWFENKFGEEVSAYLSGQKLLKRLAYNDTPDSRALRAGLENIHAHLEYIAWLTERRSWLAGEALSFADIVAGAHISLIDYSGDVPWKDHPLAKEWYVRLKSRPSFRPLLAESFPGIPPARVYSDLDF